MQTNEYSAVNSNSEMLISFSESSSLMKSGIDPKLINEKNVFGDTSLHLAASRNKGDVTPPTKSPKRL